MNRINFFTQKTAIGAAFRCGCDAHGHLPAQELRTEEQGANMSFSKFPRVPAIGGSEVRIPKMHSSISWLLLVCLIVLPRLAAQMYPAPSEKRAVLEGIFRDERHLPAGIDPRRLEGYVSSAQEVEDAFESSTSLVVEGGASHPPRSERQAHLFEQCLVARVVPQAVQ